MADLERRTGAGEVLGSTATGGVLSPEMLRRIACDAALVPHVLGTAGEDLDLGRVVRLFTRAQRRRLVAAGPVLHLSRVHGPASWSRAHHVGHWADGGLSDIDNAALLCERHHTLVHHTTALGAGAVDTPDELGRSVVWDLNGGSYDRHLEHLRREQAVHDPPPLTRQRLLELVAAITGDDDGDRRLAESDLTHYADAQYWAGLR